MRCHDNRVDKLEMMIAIDIRSVKRKERVEKAEKEVKTEKEVSCGLYYVATSTS